MILLIIAAIIGVALIVGLFVWAKLDPGPSENWRH